MKENTISHELFVVLLQLSVANFKINVEYRAPESPATLKIDSSLAQLVEQFSSFSWGARFIRWSLVHVIHRISELRHVIGEMDSMRTA